MVLCAKYGKVLNKPQECHMLMKENGYKGELNQVNPWYIPVTSNLSF